MRRAALGTVLVGGLLAAGGCSSSSSPPSSGPASTSSGTSAAASTSTSTSSTATVTSTRPPAQLQAALLGAADVPQGWTVYPSTASATTTAATTAAATSTDPVCAGFLELVKDSPNPLPPNQAHVEFDGGNLRPPYVVESLEAYPDAGAAAAALKAQQQSVAACPSVTYTVEGNSSPVTVSQEEPPSVTVPSFGIRLTATTGGLKGYDARVVNAQVGDAVVSLTFLSATPDQVGSLSKAAVTKAAGVLKTG